MRKIAQRRVTEAFVNNSEAAEMLGTKPPNVAKMLERHGVVAQTLTVGARTMRVYLRDDVERVVRNRKTGPRGRGPACREGNGEGVSGEVGGWSDLGGQARKFHYFPDPAAGTRALCNKWAIFRAHPLQADTAKATPDDCVACRRKLEATRRGEG